MIKKILILSIIFVSLTAVFCRAEENCIAVIKSSDVEPYQVALKGFKDTLSKQAGNIKYSEYNLEGDGKALQDKITRDIQAKPCKLILTIGSGATGFARNNFKNIPIVFAMVLNPVASGFVATMDGASGTNITGAAMDIPLVKEFEVIRSTIPELKRIVAFYSPRETEVIIRRAKDAASALGLSFEAVQINAQKDIGDSLPKLTSRQDALWALADSKVYTPQNTQFIILETLRNGIPFIGLSPAFVKAGALLALSCNYQENGEQAAELAIRILKGENPANLPVTTPQKVEISINANTAKHIKVEVPGKILKEAANIF